MPNKHILLPVLVAVADSLARQGTPLPALVDAQITLAAKSQSYYERTLLKTVRDRYEGKTDDRTFLLLFGLLIDSQLRRAYEEGLQDAGYEGGMTGGMGAELAGYEFDERQHAQKLLNDIKLAIAAGAGWLIFQNRMQMWGNRYLDVHNRAMVAGGRWTDARFEWRLGATEHHCTDCLNYNGQIRTAADWENIYRMTGHRPQSHELECKGYLCDCWFARVR